MDEIECYYGIQIPPETELPTDLELKPFYTDRLEAFAVMKKIKPARMKKFASSGEATAFSCSSSSIIVSNPEADSIGVVSESLPFSSVRIQDLVKLRTAIEKGDTDKIKELIDSNPRYLIGSGDNPTILQERFRYNALHSAAIKGQSAAAEVIINYLSSPQLYLRLFPNEDELPRQNRMKFLLDLYLNTPDKGCNETPLHFACKFGNSSVVSLFLNEPLINKEALNKDGLTAKQLVCTRSGGNTEKSQILELFEGQYYIPVYRSESDDMMPVVGVPWSPDVSRHDQQYSRTADDFSSSPLNYNDITSPIRSTHQNRLPRIDLRPSISCPSAALEPLEHMVVKAVAGPMSPQKAADFRRKLTSPCLSAGQQRGSSPLRGRTPVRGAVDSPSDELSTMARQDPYKGLEIVGRELAKEMRVPWSEYWEFLDCAVDLKSSDGLSKLEEYLREQEKEYENMKEQEATTPLRQNQQDYQAGGDVTPQREADTPNHSTIITPITAVGESKPNLNSTDDQLADLFETLTIHSPSSPNQVQPTLNSHQDTPPTVGKSDIDTPQSTSLDASGKQELKKTTPTASGAPSRRSLLSYLVPTIVVSYMDRLKGFWPFGRGGFTPRKAESSESDFDDSMDLPQTPVVECTAEMLARKAEEQERQLLLETPQKQETDKQTESDDKQRPAVYIKGLLPCKVDRDVMKALDDCDVSVDAYPAVSNWMRNVSSYSADEQLRWQSPSVNHKSREVNRQTPRRRLDKIRTTLVME